MEPYLSTHNYSMQASAILPTGLSLGHIVSKSKKVKSHPIEEFSAMFTRIQLENGQVVHLLAHSQRL